MIITLEQSLIRRVIGNNFRNESPFDVTWTFHQTPDRIISSTAICVRLDSDGAGLSPI